MLLLWLVQMHAVVLAINDTVCYQPSGMADDKTLPCNFTAIQLGGASPCCSGHDICFGDGVCYQDWSGVMYRAGCTDPTFVAPECPKICLTGK